MPGRFHLPQPRMRDGWFRVKGLDVTTTVIVVALSVLSMFVYAADRVTLLKGILFGELVTDGELWRLITWPVVNPPDSIFVVLSLAFFWFVGHYAEELLGRVRFTWVIVVATVASALVGSLVAAGSTFDYGLSTLNLSLLIVLALDRPNMPIFFGIPVWVMAAIYGVLNLLRLTADQYWGSILVFVLCAAICVVAFRSFGHLTEAAWVPAVPLRGNTQKRKRATPKGRAVVQGPWGETGFTPTTPSAAQAELDHLLDKISAGGMDSLSRAEKQRLNELSKRLRGS